MTTSKRFATTAMIKIALLSLLALGATAQAQPGPAGSNAPAPGIRPGGPGAPGAPGGPARFGRPGQPGAERPFMRRMMMAHMGDEGRGGRHGGWEGKRKGRGGKGHDFMMGMMLLRPEVRQKLNITDDQAQKIKDLQFNTARQKIELGAQVKLAQLELTRLLHEPRPDRAKVLAQVDAVAKAKAAMGRAKVEAHLNLRDILTDEQINKVKTFMQERMAERGKRGGPWGGRGQQGFGGKGPGQQQGQPGGQGQGGPGQGQGFGRRMGLDRGFGQNAPAGPVAERVKQIRERMEERRLSEQPAAPAPPAPPAPANAPATTTESQPAQS